MRSRCDRCKRSKTSVSRYGQPRWVSMGRGGYLCWSCHIVRNNTGRIFSHERKKNISMAIRRALDSGAIMGPKVHTVNEAVFDTITEESAYWLGFLMADGNINTGKTGNPRIALTLAERDREHLVKFRKFLNCSNQILLKIVKVNEKTWNQYTLRFSSKNIADRLNEFGITKRKSLTAKSIGLEDNKHFWRGVLDGDGYIKNRDGRWG
jgi:DNA-binding transcriptional regulator WhiA